MSPCIERISALFRSLKSLDVQRSQEEPAPFSKRDDGSRLFGWKSQESLSGTVQFLPSLAAFPKDVSRLPQVLCRPCKSEYLKVEPKHGNMQQALWVTVQSSWGGEPPPQCLTTGLVDSEYTGPGHRSVFCLLPILSTWHITNACSQETCSHVCPRDS